MLEMSSSGLGQPKQKSINVEVNLLSEWLESRARTRDQSVRSLALLVLAFLTAGIFLPWLGRVHASVSHKAAHSSAQLVAVQQELGELQREVEVSQPKLDDEAMRTAVRRQARLFLGQTAFVLNAATAGMAFETVAVDVIGGEATIRCKADAEHEAVQEAFLERVNRGPHVMSSLLANSRRTGSLGPEGLSFEYVKKVRMEQ